MQIRELLTDVIVISVRMMTAVMKETVEKVVVRAVTVLSAL